MSQFDRGDLPPELDAVADQLRSHRYEASPLELDQTKTRILKRAGGRQAAGGIGMRKRSLLTAVIMFAAIGTGSAAALAVVGVLPPSTPIIGSLQTSKPTVTARSAAKSMYGPGRTVTTVRCDPNPVTVNTPTTCSATVTAPGNAEAPTGIVSWGTNQGGTFSAGSCVLHEIGGNQSQCTVTFTPHHKGLTKIYAAYSGDKDFQPSHGSTFLVVVQTASSLTVGCSPATFTLGHTTTCTATVTGTEHPTGTVKFASNVGGTFNPPSGTCTLVLIGGNQARCSVTFTPRHRGSAKIYANYSGDLRNPPSHTSTTVTVN